MKKIIVGLTWLIMCILVPVQIHAQDNGNDVFETTVQAEITGYKKYDCYEQECIDYLLELNEGDQKGKELTITISPEEIPVIQSKNYQIGDKVIVIENSYNGEVDYFISDHVRTDSILLLAVLFVITVVAIGKFKGVKSLLSLLLSIFVLFVLVLPAILNGNNPVFIASIGAIAIAIPAIYLSHGFNKKSTTALAGTLLSIIIMFVLSVLFTNLMKLTGFSSEEAMYLYGENFSLNMKGILLASVLFSGIGILDDVTVSQASVVKELSETNEKLGKNELYKKAMRIGQDHISSMVNTLFLAYASSAFPLILLLRLKNISFQEIINNEMIAEEILRTLIGSIGLVLAVPITTLLATHFLKRKDLS